MSRLFSLALLGTAVWLLASSAVLAQEVPRDKKPQPPAANVSRPADREAAIEKALASPTQIEFVETPLQDVIDYLKDYHHIEIQIDAKALNDVGVDPSKTITKNLKGISFRSALKLILRELKLTYVIQDEVLLITTPQQAETRLTTKVYPVADLVVCRNSKGEPWDDYDTLIEVITTTIDPATWDQNGGSGSISGASLGTAKILIVSQAQDVHQQITDLLEQIRAVAAKNPDAGPPRRDKQEPANRGCCLPAY
jgi:hypothetical protein